MDPEPKWQCALKRIVGGKRLSNGQPINGVTAFLLNSFRIVLIGFVGFIATQVWNQGTQIAVNAQVARDQLKKVERIEQKVDRNTDHAVTSHAAASPVELQKLRGEMEANDKLNRTDHEHIKEDLTKMVSSQEKLNAKVDQILRELKK